MKRIITFSLAGVFGVILITTIVAEVISFKIVKQATDAANKGLNDKFQTIVFIPGVIPPSYKGFYQTTYTWEMETPQKEVSKVVFTHDTGFSKSQNVIKATISMEENADPSVFNKVLPAVVGDVQALTSAQNQKEASLGANSSIGYNKLELVPVTGDPTKVTRISWEFEKDKLIGKDDIQYQKLYSLPEPLAKFLFSLQQFTIGIFST